MKHRAFAPVFGFLAAAGLFAAGTPSQALAGDPAGVWAKDDGSAKIEVRKCGRGLCTKIVWLRSPNDSRGKPLHDARNENASMRGRPILGMNLFSNVNQVDANTWQGSVYNPEEGKFYTDVKVTLVSSRQIVLKGCKAWLLCGEKVWTRTSAPPPVEAPVPNEEQQIEAKATPDQSAPKPATPVVEASAEPAPPVPPKATEAPASAGMQPTVVEANAAAMEFPKVDTKTTLIAPGMAETKATAEPLPLTGEDVSSMIVMSKPPASEQATAPATSIAVKAPAAPSPAKAEPIPVKAAPAPRKEAVMETASRDPEPESIEANKQPKPHMQGSADAAPVVDTATKPKVKPRPAEPAERLPWLPPVAPRY